MSTRHVISYDDITLPYTSTDDQPSIRPPPAKKRKKNKTKQVNNAHFRPSRVVDENATAEYDEVENRELTHQEIWDDSALLDAWEAAQREYGMRHGTDKDWKHEPVKKSPLWYNIPVDQTTKGESTTAAQSDDVELDSQPLNFDTFVSTHDPSLSIPAVDQPSNYVGNSTSSMVSQDEAVSRAMSAMYWGGYWTAMYHCQRHLTNLSGRHAQENEASEGDESNES